MKKMDVISAVIAIFAFLFLLSCGGESETGSVAIKGVEKGSITIDGKANEWNDINPLTQEVGQPGQGESLPKIDIHSVKVTWDQDYLYILLEAAHVINSNISFYID